MLITDTGFVSEEEQDPDHIVSFLVFESQAEVKHVCFHARF